MAEIEDAMAIGIEVMRTAVVLDAAARESLAQFVRRETYRDIKRIAKDAVRSNSHPTPLALPSPDDKPIDKAFEEWLMTQEKPNNA